MQQPVHDRRHGLFPKRLSPNHRISRSASQQSSGRGQRHTLEPFQKFYPFLLSRSECVKTFSDLSEREILAVAIAAEEEDSRIYLTFAEMLREQYPASAKVFVEMAEEEKNHRHLLFDLYENRFGPDLPAIRREDVKGFLRREPIWLSTKLSLDAMRRKAETMEFEAHRFYSKAAERTTDTGI